MGGVAGHMLHPYEIDNFTFGDYKKLINDLFTGKIEHVTEKFDGMNIFATVDLSGNTRFARNGGQVKSEEGGMGINEMAERWSDPTAKDNSIFKAYKNAYLLFNDVVRKLKDPVSFFNGEGYRIYVNCEVIDPVHPNIIHYLNMGKVLSFHGLVAIMTDGSGQEIDLPDEVYDQKMAILEKIFPDVNSEYGKAQVTPEVDIKIREDYEEAIEKYIALIDQIVSNAGVSDETTIIEYRAKLLPEWMERNGYEVLLNSQVTDYFMGRWIYGKKEPNIKQYEKIMAQNGVENWQEIGKMARLFEGGFKKGSPWENAMEEIMEPVEFFFYSLGNEILKGVEDYSNLGKESQVLDSYAEQLRATQEMLQASGDLEYQKDMTKYLHKLAMLGNKYNAIEGVVFKYGGKTLKLTGSFAALNRAINIKLQLNKK